MKRRGQCLTAGFSDKVAECVILCVCEGYFKCVCIFFFSSEEVEFKVPSLTVFKFKDL